MRCVFILMLFSAVVSRGSSRALPGCHDVLKNVLTMKQNVEDYIKVEQKNNEGFMQEKRKIKMMTGLDVDDEAAVEALVCKVIKVNTVEELMEVINIPIPFRKQFQMSYNSISAHFKSNGLQETQEFLSYQLAGKSFLYETGFPDFPLGISYDDALNAISDLPYSTVRMLFPWRDRNIDQIAESLEVAQSLEEFMELTNSTEYRSFYTGIRELNDYGINYLIAGVALAEQATELGLLDLRTAENDVHD